MGFYHCFKNGPDDSIGNRAPVQSSKISKTGQNRDERGTNPFFDHTNAWFLHQGLEDFSILFCVQGLYYFGILLNLKAIFLYKIDREKDCLLFMGTLGAISTR